VHDRILTIRSVHDTGYVHDTGECIIVYNVLAVLADLRELYAMCTVVWCESFCYIIWKVASCSVERLSQCWILVYFIQVIICRYKQNFFLFFCRFFEKTKTINKATKLFVNVNFYVNCMQQIPNDAREQRGKRAFDRNKEK
jgi:hypothetical protein